MKNYTAAALATALCVILGVARWIDLLLYTDVDTGFITAGTLWMRLAPLALVVVLLAILARNAKQRPAGLAGHSLYLGATMMLTGVVLAVAGAASLLELFGKSTGQMAASGILSLMSGVWFFVQGSSFAFAQGGEPLRSAVQGVLGTLFFLWVAVLRFALQPAAMARLTNMALVLSGGAAMLFGVALVKVFSLPRLEWGKDIFFSGMLCFLLCSCLELPQTLYGFINGIVTARNLFNSLALGALGLCGLVCGWAACGEALPPDKNQAQAQAQPGNSRKAAE